MGHETSVQAITWHMTRVPACHIINSPLFASTCSSALKISAHPKKFVRQTAGINKTLFEHWRNDCCLHDRLLISLQFDWLASTFIREIIKQQNNESSFAWIGFSVRHSTLPVQNVTLVMVSVVCVMLCEGFVCWRHCCQFLLWKEFVYFLRFVTQTTLQWHVKHDSRTGEELFYYVLRRLNIPHTPKWTYNPELKYGDNMKNKEQWKKSKLFPGSNSLTNTTNTMKTRAISGARKNNSQGRASLMPPP